MSEQWYYAKGDQKHGPVTAATFKELAASGQLLPRDLLWKEGMEQWAKAGIGERACFPTHCKQAHRHFHHKREMNHRRYPRLPLLCHYK